MRLTNGTTAQFLHITDIHMDPFYNPSSTPSSSCHDTSLHVKNPLPIFGFPNTNCDTPSRLVKATLESLSTASSFHLPDIRFVMWTGDSSRHDRDRNNEKSRKESVEQNRIVIDMFTKYIPVGIPIIPTIGNWEVFPKSNLACLDKDPQLMHLWESWRALFRGEEEETRRVERTFLKGGYFSKEVMNGMVTVLSLNTLSFFVDNPLVSDCAAFEISKSGKRPFVPKHVGDMQLIWIEEYLQVARREGRKVILQGHVGPMGNDHRLWKKDCFEWYVFLSGEYSDVILGQYFGHSNRDLIHAISARDGKNDNPFEITTLTPPNVKKFNLKASRIVSPLFTGSSILPVFNPGYRVGVLETQSSKHGDQVVLKQQWTMFLDLEKANRKADGDKNARVKYLPSCDTLSDYGMPDLTGPKIESWVSSMQGDGKGGNREGDKLLDMYSHCIQTSLNVDYWRDGKAVLLDYEDGGWVLNGEIVFEWALMVKVTGSTLEMTER
ncbi:Endopolyphosphatase [Podochytrium sp. JEL0797]|nr:Endopolyphosphatase [Podochytrium sp. JEL0797]